MITIVIGGRPNGNFKPSRPIGSSADLLKDFTAGLVTDLGRFIHTGEDNWASKLEGTITVGGEPGMVEIFVAGEPNGSFESSLPVIEPGTPLESFVVDLSSGLDSYLNDTVGSGCWADRLDGSIKVSWTRADGVVVDE